MNRNNNLFNLIRANEIDAFKAIFTQSEKNQINDFKQTLLHIAIAYNSDEIAKILLDADINIGAQDNKGQTALHYAAVYHNTYIAQLILSMGGNPNIKDIYGNNSLWTAVFNARGKYDIVKLYIFYGADEGSKNNVGKTSIDFAKQIKDEQLLNILHK